MVCSSTKLSTPSSRMLHCSSASSLCPRIFLKQARHAHDTAPPSSDSGHSSISKSPQCHSQPLPRLRIITHSRAQAAADSSAQQHTTQSAAVVTGRRRAPRNYRAPDNDRAASDSSTSQQHSTQTGAVHEWKGLKAWRARG